MAPLTLSTKGLLSSKLVAEAKAKESDKKRAAREFKQTVLDKKAREEQERREKKSAAERKFKEAQQSLNGKQELYLQVS